MANLNMDEELIYYKTEETAVTIVFHGDIYVVRKKEISTNRKMRESILKTIDEVMESI